MPLPPLDSQVRLAPGGSFTLDAETEKEWDSKATALRATRGAILSFSFEIEHSIDVVSSRFFFSAEDKKSEELKLLFDELFLKSQSANFARKIQIFKALSNQPVLSSLVPPDLSRHLDQVRDLRNRFAHYPITFDPAPGESKEKLIAVLVCRDKEITLDDAFLKECHELFASVQGDLQKVLSVFHVNKP